MRVTLVASLFLTTLPGIATGQRAPNCAAVLAQSASYPLSFPYVGHLVAGGYKQHLCYATLVSPQGHVLTAAHCLFQNDYDVTSPFQTDLRLCMGDKGELPLQIVSVNTNLDYAILKAPSVTEDDRGKLARYGWASFASGRPRANETMIRSGSGRSCFTTDKTEDFHLRLDCGGKEGDSGEAVLARGQVAGIITTTSSSGSSAISSYLLFPTEASLLGAPRPSSFFIAEGIPRVVARGSSMDIDIVAEYHDPGDPKNVNLDISPANGLCQTTPEGLSPVRREVCSLSPSDSFDIHYNARVNWEDILHWINLPWDSSDREFSGTPVETIHVIVEDPASLVWTGRAYAYTDIQRDPDPEKPWNYGYSAYLTGVYLIQKPEIRLRGSYFVVSAPGVTLTTPIRHFSEFAASVDGLACNKSYSYKAVALLDHDPVDGTCVLEEGKLQTFRTPPCTPTRITKNSSLALSSVGRDFVAFTPNVNCEEPGPCSPVSWLITYSYLKPPLGPMITATTPGLPGNTPEVTLGNLCCGTTYYLAVNAVTYWGVVPIGSTFQFTTASCSSRPPAYCR